MPENSIKSEAQQETGEDQRYPTIMALFGFVLFVSGVVVRSFDLTNEPGVLGAALVTSGVGLISLAIGWLLGYQAGKRSAAGNEGGWS